MNIFPRLARQIASAATTFPRPLEISRSGQGKKDALGDAGEAPGPKAGGKIFERCAGALDLLCLAADTHRFGKSDALIFHTRKTLRQGPAGEIRRSHQRINSREILS